MLVMDMPDVPPQYAPVLVAEAAQAKKPVAADRTVGVCHLIDTRLGESESAVNSFGTLAAARYYFWKVEGIDISRSVSGTTKVIEGPAHGRLEERQGPSYQYIPTPGYQGQDQATFLVEIGGYKVKLIYFFNLLSKVPGGTEGYGPYRDINNCPKGPAWRISLNPDDPNAPIYTFEHPYQLTSPYPTYNPDAHFNHFHFNMVPPKRAEIETPGKNIVADATSGAAVGVRNTEKSEFDGVASVCKKVLSASNNADMVTMVNELYPSATIKMFLSTRGIKLAVDEKVQIRVVALPQHGQLVPNAMFPDAVFIYRANAGYLGLDRITFEVEVRGKKYKIIQSISVQDGWVEDTAPCNPGGANGSQYDQPNQVGASEIWDVSIETKKGQTRLKIWTPVRWAKQIA